LPFKDTPGLRRIAAAAIEARDVVSVRLLRGSSFRDADGVVYREGQTMEMPRRHALELEASGAVVLID
jgi:hypothetical protein